MEGTLIASCGMDHSIKIWRFDNEPIQEAIKKSYTYKSTKSDK